MKDHYNTTVFKTLLEIISRSSDGIRATLFFLETKCMTEGRATPQNFVAVANDLLIGRLNLGDELLAKNTKVFDFLGETFGFLVQRFTLNLHVSKDFFEALLVFLLLTSVITLQASDAAFEGRVRFLVLALVSKIFLLFLEILLFEFPLGLLDFRVLVQLDRIDLLETVLLLRHATIQNVELRLELVFEERKR